LAAFDEHAAGYIVGIDAIAAAARMSPDHFRKRRFDVPTTREVVGPGVLSCHTGLGHFFQIQGTALTHQSSAAAWGENIRDLVAAERRSRVPGWFGAGRCPISAGSIAIGVVATTAPVPPSVAVQDVLDRDVSSRAWAHE
jgi:hypothetical protein